jgi:trans-2,3-dihydro-3-hydroxyanthranilate isomerase
VGHRLTWLDVFTVTPLTGNGLAVVHDADDLDDDTMLAFARETRLSETTYVQRPTTDKATYRNRIWFPNGELPFAGHPSLGTAVAVAWARGDREASYVQETGAGLQAIDVELGEGMAARASMLQEPASFGPELDRADVVAAAGLTTADAAPGLPPQVVSTGLAHVIAPVREAAVLARAAPAAGALRGLMTAYGCTVLYLVAWDSAAGSARARGFFAVPGGVMEDPGTGSAAGPLCAYLAERAGVSSLTISQGVEMGRSSTLECELAGDGVRVGGDVVVVADGTLLL